MYIICINSYLFIVAYNNNSVGNVNSSEMFAHFNGFDRFTVDLAFFRKSLNDSSFIGHILALT